MDGVVEFTPETAEAYLRSRKIVAGPAEIQALGWGISNVVLRVRTDTDCFVLKQSLPELRVDAVWEFDRRRIFVERDCLVYLGSVLPDGTVPELRFFDDANFVFAMSCAPPGGVLWKEALLRGEIDLLATRRAGSLLAAVQRLSARDASVRDRFGDQAVLLQGRINPYHRAAIAANPGLKPVIEEEVERLLATRRTLVLGDYAPKNTIVYPDGILILDFEVAHWGDPSFDPAFCLNHLLLKAIRFPRRSREYLEAARVFWRAYREGIVGDWTIGIEEASARELGCLLLARIDGKSRVEYITDDETRAFARRLAADILVEAVDHPEDVLAEAERRLARRSAATVK